MRKGNWIRLVILIGALSTLLAAQHARVGEPVAYFVTVYNPGGAAPGVPVIIRVKDREGRTVADSKTDATGKARFGIAASDVPSAVTLEALLDLGAGRSVGTIETITREPMPMRSFCPRSD